MILPERALTPDQQEHLTPGQQEQAQLYARRFWLQARCPEGRDLEFWIRGKTRVLWESRDLRDYVYLFSGTLSAEEHELARQYAYGYWEGAGRPEGRDLEFWWRGRSRVVGEWAISSIRLVGEEPMIEPIAVVRGRFTMGDLRGELRLFPPRIFPQSLHDADQSFFRHGL